MADSTTNAEATLAAELEAAAPRHLRAMRLWFFSFAAWMCVLAAVAQVNFNLYEAGQLQAIRLWILALMCFYLSLCNTFLPLPTSWIIMLCASEEVMLFESPILRVAVVAVCGGIATVVANLNEYHLLHCLLGRRLAARLRTSGVYRWAIRWFDAAPFSLLALIALIPIPVDAVRWLAILRGYSRWRYAAAYFVGRAPRYAVLAAVAVVATPTVLQIALIQLALIIPPLLRVLWSLIRRRRIAAV